MARPKKNTAGKKAEQAAAAEIKSESAPVAAPKAENKKQPRTKSKTASPKATTVEPVAEVKETVPASKAESKKQTRTKSADSKPATKKAAKSDVFLIQASGNEYTAEQIKELCINAYRNGTRKHVKSINVYLKAENGGIRAYYVVNGNSDGLYIDL